jgi:predicted metal-dependent hydrolase
MRYRIDKIVFGDSDILYQVNRTNRRQTIAITVKPDTSVNVAAPKGTRRLRIATAVTEKAKWILKQKDWFARNGKAKSHRMVSGESILYLGRQYQLKVFLLAGRHVVPNVMLARGKLIVTIPRHWSEYRQRSTVRSALIKWYSAQAKSYMVSLVQRYADRLAVQYTSIHVCDMQKRWGSGGTSGRLRFNWRIMMAPRRLIEYVIAHELCHIQYNDHSQAFWRYLSRVIPDYIRRRTELEFNGLKYDLHD